MPEQREPPWSEAGARASVVAAADHIEAALDRGVDPADLEQQMDVLEAFFAGLMRAQRSNQTYAQVVRDTAEAMEETAREEAS